MPFPPEFVCGFWVIEFYEMFRVFVTSYSSKFTISVCCTTLNTPLISIDLNGLIIYFKITKQIIFTKMCMSNGNVFLCINVTFAKLKNMETVCFGCPGGPIKLF